MPPKQYETHVCVYLFDSLAEMIGKIEYCYFKTISIFKNPLIIVNILKHFTLSFAGVLELPQLVKSCGMLLITKKKCCE